MKVGFIGTGLMGLPMAQRLKDANIEVVAYNRTVSKLEPLKAQGVTIAETPLDVIRACQCIITMLTNAEAIHRLLLSTDCLAELAGRTVIQMGTISPSQSLAIKDKIIAAQGEYLEAPVLGSIPEAESGKLIVMVGSTPEQFSQWTELLKNFTSEPMLIGEVGKAAAMKLALNQLITSLTTAFAQSLGFLMRENVNTEQFMEILRQSALYAPTFDKKLQRMLDRNYANPNFPTKHLLKDTNLFIEEAESVGLNVSGILGIKEVLELAMKTNPDDDYSALFEAVNPVG